MARTNPALIKGRIKTVPKGKRKGQIVTRSGKRYRVVSYVTKTGKRVRYLQAVSKCGTPARKASCKVKRTARKTRKNPFLPSPASLCRLPGNTDLWYPGHTFVDRRGFKCAIQRTRGKKGGKRGYAAYAHTTINRPSVRNRSVGATFQFAGDRFRVTTKKTRAGGRRKVAVLVSR
jgi:hypothetical protein